MKKSFYSYSFKELQDWLASHDLSLSGAALLYKWHLKLKKTTPCIQNLSTRTQDLLREEMDFSLPQIIDLHESEDLTVKLKVQLHDGTTVESVLIPFQNKYALCLSSQVGCAMKCSFCFTGTQGLKRHLATEEIIGQYIVAWKWLEENRPEGHQIKSIVFMGQGEPLHNFDAVKKACDIFLDQHGMSIGIQKITISTAGYLPGLLRWKEEIPGVNLALSLHSLFEEKRNALIPINQKWPIDEVLSVIDSIPLSRKQYVTYEYLMAQDFNDLEEDAHALGKALFGKQAIINLIPFNPFPGSNYRRSLDDQIEKFQKIVETYHLPVLIRSTKGDDILAACGQLNTKVKA